MNQDQKKYLMKRVTETAEKKKLQIGSEPTKLGEPVGVTREKLQECFNKSPHTLQQFVKQFPADSSVTFDSRCRNGGYYWHILVNIDDHAKKILGVATYEEARDAERDAQAVRVKKLAAYTEQLLDQIMLGDAESALAELAAFAELEF